MALLDLHLDDELLQCALPRLIQEGQVWHSGNHPDITVFCLMKGYENRGSTFSEVALTLAGRSTSSSSLDAGMRSSEEEAVLLAMLGVGELSLE